MDPLLHNSETTSTASPLEEFILPQVLPTLCGAAGTVAHGVTGVRLVQERWYLSALISLGEIIPTTRAHSGIPMQNPCGE